MQSIQKVWKWFICGLFIRVLLLSYISTGIPSSFFIPFLENATNYTINPWLNISPETFPYGTLMWFIVNLPRTLLIALGFIHTAQISVLLFKLPLLIFDFLFYYLGLRICKDQELKWTLLFWLNPILIYISTIHGQLDVIPMYFTALSLFYFGKYKNFKASLAFAAAIGTKFHVVILLPIIFAYIWNNWTHKESTKRIITTFTIICLAVLASYWLPAQAHFGIYNTIGSPEAEKLFGFFFNFGNNSLFLGLFFVVLLMIRITASERLTEESLLISSALIFLIILMSTSPREGWFYWVVPQIALFYILYPYAPKIIFLAQIILYFCFFQTAHKELLINHLQLSDLMFTTLQAVNLALLVIIWTFTSKNLFSLGVRVRPVTIGIAGDSGSGKNRLSVGIKELYGHQDILEMEGDDYHKWERGHKAWTDYTHLNPRANFLSYMRTDIEKLISGGYVFYPHYDHSIGQFTSPRLKFPKKAVLIQGLHTLYIKGVRNLIDLKIFIEPHYLIRLGWKIDRDSGERGHQINKIITSIKNREEDGIKFIQTQKQFADCIITYLPIEESDITEEHIIQGLRPQFKVEYRAWNDMIGVLEELSYHLNLHNVTTSIQCDTIDSDRLIFTVNGQISADNIKNISAEIFPNTRLITRSKGHPSYLSDFDGIHQLVILGLLQFKRSQRNAL